MTSMVSIANTFTNTNENEKENIDKNTTTEPYKNPNANTNANQNPIHSTLTENSEKIPFWAQNPNILFRIDYLFEFFPTEDMTYEQKMNAITRLITILTILGFFISRNVRIFFIYIIILGGISLAYYSQSKEMDKKGESGKEGYSEMSPGMDYLKQNDLLPKEQLFDSPTSVNPMSNVLMTDYDYNPNKKPAAPSFNKNVNEDILSQAKQFISDANPDQPDIVKKLFKNVDDQIDFEQSMRQFYSNPNTMIPNDQQAFAEFCYGSMISCKEGNRFACARNLARHTN
jgi:hypothetical protein